jgi:hypothetical protein
VIRYAAVLAASLVAAASFAQAVPPTAVAPSPSPSPSVLPAASPAPKPTPTPPPGPPIVVWLLNGDRLTGTVASESKTSLRVKLPFASVLIPKSRIERVVRGDGKEEVLHEATEHVTVVAPAPSAPAVPTAHLVLVITGASFWQAWDRKEPPADPTLRLQVRIDEQAVAAWADGTLDPQDLKGAIVNTFAFTGDEAAMAAPHVLLSPAEVQPGRVVLRVDVPRAVGENRRLGIVYQVNEGSVASPAWRDVAMATATLPLRGEGPSPIQIRQARGQMEFARKHMREVESFKIEISTE